MRRYEKTILFHIETNIDCFKDKLIIDIAGFPTELNKHLLDQGVAEVHGVNLKQLDDFVSTPSRYFHHVADARALPVGLPMADVITSSCALEHLPDLPIILREALSKLKPGGVLIMHGGALWPSMLGHHVWVSTPERNYYFGQPNDPIPPWGHLSHTEAELECLLVQQGLPADHVTLILADIFQSSSKNRRSASSLRQDFQLSKQLLLGFTEYRWGMPNPLVNRRIAERGHNYDLNDLMTGELVAVIRKL